MEKEWFEYSFDEYLENIKRNMKRPINRKKEIVLEPIEQVDENIDELDQIENVPVVKKRKIVSHGDADRDEIIQAVILGYRVRRKQASGKGKEMIDSIEHAQKMMSTETDSNFISIMAKQLRKTKTEFIEFMDNRLPYLLEYDTLHKPVVKNTKKTSKKMLIGGKSSQNPSSATAATVTKKSSKRLLTSQQITTEIEHQQQVEQEKKDKVKDESREFSKRVFKIRGSGKKSKAKPTVEQSPEKPVEVSPQKIEPIEAVTHVEVPAAKQRRKKATKDASPKAIKQKPKLKVKSLHEMLDFDRKRKITPNNNTSRL